MPIDSPNEAAAGVRYAYKASLIGWAHQFELTNGGLSWQVGSKFGMWPYADISAIRLSHRPVSMQSRRFRAEIENISGGRISILSTTWQTAALMAAQDEDYGAFITCLHERLQRAGSGAALIGGLRPRVYAAALTLLMLVAIAMAGLLVRAVATDEWTGALFMVGFAALFAWQIGGFVRRNRPRAYTFEHLPEALLPSGGHSR